MGNEVGAFQWITIVFLVLNGLGMPAIIWIMTQARQDRKERFESMHERLTHLDECLHDVKEIVVGKAVTRADLTEHRNEINDIINRQRMAISNETNGLHERIFRIENRFFGVHPSSAG